MRLYTHPLSGHGHRVELLLAVLAVGYERIVVDLVRGEQRGKDFQAINPWGQIPVLVDNDVVVAESTAILTYVALKYDDGSWLPRDAIGAAAVQAWLSRASGPLAYGLSVARLTRRFGGNADLARAQAEGRRLLVHMERELATRPFLARRRPTLADIAMYSYVTVAPEGGVDLEPFRAVNRWLLAMKNLPRFVPFQ